MSDPSTSSTRWARAFAAVAPAAAVVSPAGVVEMATEGFLKMVGLEAEAVVGRPLAAVLSLPADDPVAATLGDGVARSQELRPPGSAAPALLSTHPFEDAEGARSAVVVLSERALAERQRVLDAARLADVGVLAGGFAHELNSPLAAVTLRVEGLLSASADEGLRAQPAFAKFPRYLASIRDDLFRCKEIVGELLNYARPRRAMLQEMHLGPLAEQVAAMLRHTAHKRGVEIAAEVQPAPPVRGDEGQLLQAVMAVARNGIEASAQGGRVVVQARGEGGCAVIEVSDHGRGIAPEIKDRLLIPFFTTKAPGEGMGLGLSLCSSIVRAHGGTLEVASEPGQGTRVALRLPAVAR